MLSLTLPVFSLILLQFYSVFMQFIPLYVFLFPQLILIFLLFHRSCSPHCLILPISLPHCLFSLLCLEHISNLKGFVGLLHLRINDNSVQHSEQNFLSSWTVSSIYVNMKRKLGTREARLICCHRHILWESYSNWRLNWFNPQCLFKALLPK